MASVDEKADDDCAVRFRTMARRYESLARGELHRGQADLFAAIAADYSELAEAAAAAPARAAAKVPPGTGVLARWLGRLRRPEAPLVWPATPTEAK